MKKSYTLTRLLFLLAFIFTIPGMGWGQINISNGSTVTENLDGLGTSATATLPTNWKTDKNTTARLVGSYSSAVSATERIGGNSLSSSASNGIYNFGAGDAATALERALGGLSSSSASKSVNLYTWLTNNGTSAIANFTISFDIEKYRNGTNAAGYTIQMYYSTDGSTWTSAGDDFKASFSADADNNGFASAPGSTISITSKVLDVSVPASGSFYLAWNYSVTSGTTTSNAQALGVDNISITANADTQAPQATFDPSNSAIEVALNSNITITFDETIRNIDDSDVDDSNVDALITLKKDNSSGADVAFDATIDVDNKVITINPTSDFELKNPGQVYYVATASVEDVADNPTGTLSSSFTARTASTTATVTSGTYTVNDVAETIIGVPAAHSLATFEGNLTPAAGATFETYEGDGTTVATDLQTGYKVIVTAEDLTTTKTYTITVNAALSTETDITAFSLAEQTGAATIDDVNHTVDIEVAYGTDRSALVATFTLSLGASAEVGATPQVSATTPNNFISPVTYTITAEDGTTTQDWTVTVTLAPSNETDFTAFSFPEEFSGADIDDINHTIDIIVDAGTNLATLTATFSLSAGASAKIGVDAQISGTTVNDFTNPVVYTVTAEDGTTTQNWTVTVTIVSNDATLSDLDVNGTNVSGFAAGTLTYNYWYPTGSAIPTTTATTTNANATKVITEAVALPGSATVEVTAQDGVTKQTYTVNFASYVENFEYTSGTALTANGWIAHSGAGTNTILVDATGLSYPGYNESGIGNSAKVVASGEDVNKGFVSQNSGSIYLATLINISAATTTGDYAIHYQNSSGSFYGRFFIKKDASNNLAFGISKAGTATTYTDYTYALNTTYLIVIKYTFNGGGTTDDVAELFVNPTILTEPAATISESAGTDATALISVALRQGSNTPTLLIDGIRVATTWADAVKKETVAPTISTLDPLDGATDVQANFTSTITFNEDIFKGTGNIYIKKVSDNSVAKTIDVTSGDVVVSTNTATISFSGNLEYNTEYYINVDATAFTDVVENAFTGISNNSDWNFTTRTASTAKEITSFSFAEQAAAATINSGDGTVSIEVVPGTNPNGLVATFALSGGASATVTGVPQVSETTANNFSSPVTYVVTAEDASTKNWTVTVFSHPALVADATDNNVDNNIEITFTDDATWRAAITAVKIGTTALTVTTDYTIAAGQLTLIPSGLNTLLTTAGDKSVVIEATGYTNTTVTQSILHGAISNTVSTAAASPAVDLNTTSTVTVTAKDQYGNVISGYTAKIDVDITDGNATTDESYTVDGTPYTSTAADVSLTNATNGSGQATFTIVTPALIDGGDGISVQVQLADGTTNVGTAKAYSAPLVPSLSISATPSLTETNLSGANVTLTLLNETFADNTFVNGNFTLTNAPATTTVSNVVWNSTTTATLTLAYDGTDFDADVTNFNITVAGSELTLANPLTSGNLTITSVVEVVPTVTTDAAITSNSQTSATWGGEVTADGGESVTQKGICWNTTGTPTIADSKTEEGAGTGNITGNMTSLTPNTLYYVRAYATNSEGTNYGAEKSFTTLAPTITLDALGASTYYAGDVVTITWSSAGVTDVKIELYDGTSYSTLVASVPATDGTDDITIPAASAYGVGYKVRISDASNATYNSESIAFTVIATPTINQIQSDNTAGASNYALDLIKTTGVITAINPVSAPKNFYLQNGTGEWSGVYVYYNLAHTFAIGDNVTIEGKVEEYNGLTEITTLTSATKNSSEAAPTPTNVTTAVASTENYEGVLVKVTKATCTSSPASGTYVLNDDSGDLTAYKSIYSALALTTGRVYDVAGVMTWYNGGGIYEIYPRSADDIYLYGNDATLTDLKYDGTTVPSFSSSTLTYDIDLPYGTTVVPAVTYTLADSKAGVVKTDAGALPGSTTVAVTSEDGVTTNTYTINFTVADPSTIATLSAFTVDGDDVLGLTDIEVASPADAGATKWFNNFTSAAGFAITRTDATATAEVKLNGTVVDPANYATEVLEDNDVILATVTAQDGTTKKYYKVTLQQNPIITATANVNGTITPNGSVVVANGADQSFTVEANSGYHISALLVDAAGVPAAVDQTTYTHTFTDITADHTIEASFALTTYTVTFNVTTGGNPLEGATVTLTGYGDQTTDASGVATFNNVAPATINYSVAKTDYNTVNSSVVVDGNESVPVTMALTTAPTYSVTFTVKEGTTAVEGATVSLTGYGSHNTDVAGVATFTGVAAANGITYTVDKTGYVQGTGSVDVVDANVDKAVSIEKQVLTITASAGANGTIAPDGSVNVTYGNNQSFDITASTGYHIASLLVDGADVPAAANLAAYTYPFNSVTANHTIAATFAINTYTITVTAGTNGTTTPSTNQVVNHGSDLSFTVAPSTGYHIKDVLVDGTSVGAVTTYTFTNVTANGTFETQFEINTYTIASTVTPLGSGTVTGDGSYTYNASVTLTAIPNTGYTFVEWKNGAAQVSTNAAYTFNATENLTLDAVFETTPVSIALYDGFTGTGNIGGDGAVGSISNGWTTHSGTVGTIDILTGSLEYSGLQSSIGNKVYIPGSSALCTRDVNAPITIVGTTAYYSVLINLVDNSQLGSTYDYFMSFGETAGGSAISVLFGRLGVKAVSATNYQLGLMNISGGTYTDWTSQLEFGKSYFVVIKVDRSASPISTQMWVNPTSFGETEPSTGFITNSTGTSAATAFASICIRNGTYTPKAHIDEIRVGETWADVTPAGSTDPSISVTATSLDDFGSVLLNTSSSTEATFNVSGVFLTNDVVITPPAGFEISTTSGSGFVTNPIKLTPTDGTLAATPVYVKFHPTLEQAYSGNIVISSIGATSVNVAVSGTGYILHDAFVTSTTYTVNDIDGTITNVPQTETLATFKSKLTAAAGATFEVYQSDGTTIATDLQTGYKVIVTAQDGTTTKTYTVTLNTTLNTETDFLTFSFAEQFVDATINSTDHTIAIQVVFGTDPANLIATFSLSGGATAKIGTTAQVSGTTANDFTNPVVYTVTAEDGTTNQDWTVTVSVLADPASITIGTLSATKYYAGETIDITWTYTSIENVLVEVWIPGNSAWQTLATVPASDGAYSQAVPADADYSTAYKLRVSDATNATINSESATFTIIPVVNSITDLKTHADGSIVKLASEAVVSFIRTANRNQKYIQDADAGILIDDATPVIITTYNIGDGITGLEGTLGSYTGVRQFVPTIDPGTASSSGNMITPIELDVNSFKTNKDQYESMLVRINNLNFATTGTFAQSTNYDVTDGTNTLQFRTFKTGESDIIGTVIPTDQLDIVAIGGEYNGTAQIYARTLADFIFAPSDVATLSDLKVDGTTVGGFSSDIDSYDVELPFGTTAVPAITYSLTDPSASAVLVNATELPGSTTVTVTAEDGVTVKVYTVNFTVAAPSTDATISSLTYTVDNSAGTIINVPITETLTAFKANLTPAAGATFEVYQSDGTTIATDLQTGYKVIVTAQDGTTTKTYTITVNTEANHEANITAFSFTEQTGAAVINSTNHTVDIEVEYGTNVTNLIATFTLSTSASAKVSGVSQVSGTTANDFTSPVTYSVTAEDGTTVIDWVVTVTVKAPSTEAFVTSTVYTVDGSAGTITNIPWNATLTAFKANLTPALDATFEVYQSDGTTVATDLQTGYKVIATAQDGTTTKTYTITLNDVPPMDLFFSEYFEGSSNNKAIEIYNPTLSPVDLSQYVVKQSNNGAGWGMTGTAEDTRYILPLSGYTIAAGDVLVIANASAGATILAEADIKLTSSGTANSCDGCNVASFNGDDALGLFKSDELIDQIGNPNEAPTAKWTVAGITGATENHTLVRKNAITIGTTDWAVSAGTDASSSQWIVYPNTPTDNFTFIGWHITKILNTEAEISAFSFAQQTGSATINSTAGTIAVEVLYGTDPSNLVASFTLSDGASATVATVQQVSGTTANNFTNPVVYHVVAEDGVTTKDWTVTVTIAATQSSAADITSFTLTQQTGDATIDAGAATVAIEVQTGTNVTALVPTIAVSAGATINPLSGVAQDFTSPVNYTVTAQDGTTKVWTVTVTVKPIVPIYDIQFTTDASGNSPYNGQTVTTTGTVTSLHYAWVSGNRVYRGFFVQDSAKAYNGLYVYTSTEVAKGDSVLVKGTITEYYTLTEMSPTSSVQVVGQGTLPSPVEVSTLNANSEGWEGVLIKVSHAACTIVDAGNGMQEVNDGSGALKVDDDIYTSGLLLSNKYNITGIGHYSFDEFKILPRDVNDIEDVTGINDNTWGKMLSAYPNPFTTEIRFNGVENVSRVMVTSLTGQVIMNVNVKGLEDRINTQGLLRGLYIVTFVNDKGERAMRKMIKE